MSATGGHLQLDSTYGCLFLTAIFSTTLWAMSCLQLYSYFEMFFRSDRLWLKIYVILLWILNTVYLVLVLKFLYVYFVKEFGNVDYLGNLGRDIYGTAPFSPAIVIMVHFLYIVRIFQLSGKNYILTGVLLLCSLSQLCSASVYIHLVHTKPLSSILGFERVMNITVLITDTLIALAMTYFLLKLRVGFKRTDGVINILVALTVGSGLLAGIVSIVAVIAAETMPNSFAYLLMDFCIAKLYVNCVLATLNARSTLRESMSGPFGTRDPPLGDSEATISEMHCATRPSIISPDPRSAYSSLPEDRHCITELPKL